MVQSLFIEELAVGTKAVKEAAPFSFCKKKKKAKAYLKIKTVLEPETVMSSSETASP